MWDRFLDWLDWQDIIGCLFSMIPTLALLMIILANFRKLVCIFEWSDAAFWGCL